MEFYISTTGNVCISGKMVEHQVFKSMPSPSFIQSFKQQQAVAFAVCFGASARKWGGCFGHSKWNQLNVVWTLSREKLWSVCPPWDWNAKTNRSQGWAINPNRLSVVSKRFEQQTHWKKRRREKATQPMAGLICCVEVGWGGGVHSWLGSINPETSQIHIHRCMLLQTRKWTHANTRKHTLSLTSTILPLAYQIAQIHTHIFFFTKTKSISVVSPLRSEKCFVIILDTRHFWPPFSAITLNLWIKLFAMYCINKAFCWFLYFSLFLWVFNVIKASLLTALPSNTLCSKNKRGSGNKRKSPSLLKNLPDTDLRSLKSLQDAGM